MWCKCHLNLYSMLRLLFDTVSTTVAVATAAMFPSPHPPSADTCTTIGVLRTTVSETARLVSVEGDRLLCANLDHAGNTGTQWVTDSPKLKELEFLQRMLRMLDSQLVRMAAHPETYRPWIMTLSAFWVGVTRNKALRQDISEDPADPTALAAFLHSQHPEFTGFGLDMEFLAWKISSLRNATVGTLRSQTPASNALQALYDDLIADVSLPLEFVHKAYFHMTNYHLETEEAVTLGQHIPLTAVMLGWLQTSLTSTVTEAQCRANCIKVRLAALEAEAADIPPPQEKRRRMV